MAKRIFLQNQNGRSSRCCWIVLDDKCSVNTRNNIADRYIIFREFIKAVV